MLRQKLDDWRVRQHFKRVEAILRNRDVSHLSPDFQQVRNHHLDQLHHYAARGVFPRNHEIPGYAPCFIDRDGRECAVAHLVIVSGNIELANHIAAAANYTYVPQMTFLELDDWAAQSGLSRAELSLIQPGYWFTLDGPLLSIAIAGWITGITAFLINAVYLSRRRIEIFMPSTGVIVSTILLLMGIFFLQAAADAHYLGTHPDGAPYDRPLQAVYPLNLAGLISLGIALLTGGISAYRMWGFFRSESDNRQQVI